MYLNIILIKYNQCYKNTAVLLQSYKNTPRKFVILKKQMHNIKIIQRYFFKYNI